jgi:hypothetical protein
MSKKHRKKRKKVRQDWLVDSFNKENHMIKESRYRGVPGFASSHYPKI